ncbi:hypothetical protein G6F57_013426 [Rhizopus arrhizus]|uniref:tRNA (guanine(9)-N1)-methyltransferase n=1 Tax=Rhizopus oryzae TaxID=64495 RepID=A0A9P6X0W1_RHIOR|nr:hypothetical protein G6F24_006389 [Rhizopus arrhizus]KAG1412333.1 hypothetical protein G6F58_008065 [Rhizopus delemar]KAG0783344.1 hypothetical protein G6F21_010592 [Rhizopus arrhizus]KAG0795342.1 hypothetical protein G6F22_005141 [Rhizopus arrhizus]KAG0809500.1 hypothetical protein G6F20_008726 [Rhizopus arrhizus]
MSLEEQKDNKGNIRTYQGREYDITDPKYAGLSKNALKKLLRDEIWEENRAQRTKDKREKLKQRKRERRQMEDAGLLEPLPKKPKSKNMTVGKVGVVFDCAFSSLMIDKEISSLRQQIARSYSANVRAKNESMKMTLTSVDDVLTKELDAKAPTWKNWRNIEVTSEPYIEKFNKENLVYLTADSENVAHELEEGKTYILGAIVDKNRYKNLCKNKADEQGIKTARLPIGDYIRLASRKVLTVNQVMEIMIKWLDCHNWEEAFMDVIPGRKLKDSELINQHKEDAEDEEKESNDEAEENKNNE